MSFNWFIQYCNFYYGFNVKYKHPTPTLLMSTWSPAVVIVWGGGCDTFGAWGQSRKHTLLGTGLWRLQCSTERLPFPPCAFWSAKMVEAAIACFQIYRWANSLATPSLPQRIHLETMGWQKSFCHSFASVSLMILMKKVTKTPFLLTRSKWSPQEIQSCHLASVIYFKVIEFFRLPQMHWSPFWYLWAGGFEMNSNFLFYWAALGLCVFDDSLPIA